MRKIIIYIIIIIFCIPAGSCHGKPKLKKTYPIDEIYCKEDMWVKKVEESKSKCIVSSILPPSGKITYNPEYLFDKDMNTSWCFKADRIGGFIIFKIPYGLKGIRIVNGLAINNELFFANNRVKKLSIGIIAQKFYYVKKGEENFDICKGNDYFLYNITTPNKTEVVLKDHQQWQKVLFSDVNYYIDGKISSKGYAFWDFDNFKKSKNLYLVVGIVDIYPGNKYNDTCISEIEIIK
jgi:hypothetical protein